MTSPFKSIRFAAAALMAGAAFATAAQATDFSNSSTYNAPYGLQPGQENQAPAPSLRDANGNLSVVNGQFTSANFGGSAGAGAGASASGASSAGGVGTHGAGTAFGNATAIGNQLNVVTLGNNNTVVVNATQNNTGTVTATNTVNGH